MKRRVPLMIGLLMAAAGLLLVHASLRKTVRIIVNGKPRTVVTYASTVRDALKQAGIAFDDGDFINPGLKKRIRNGERISLERTASVCLDAANGGDPVCFLSHQRFGGNILLDLGLRVYPGDRIFWGSTEIRPDFDLGPVSDLELRLVRADGFTLITEKEPLGKPAYGSGETVYDALLSAGIGISRSMMVIPDGDSAFVSGMVIEVLPLRELTVVRDGKRSSVISAGASVGEALARAGMPLTGFDVSIPAAGEPLPADGRILIIPAAEYFSMNAETVRYETDWTANEEMELDSTRLLSEGRDGLRGTFTRIRSENGEQVLNETSAETVLVQPVREKREYGTKITVRTLDTPDGPVEYYRAVNVYATSYSPCRSGTSGCITGTASGMKVQKGVIAVTSGWYNLFGGQSVYVPDYGKAVIADVGGGIAGRKWIDLAYDDDNFEGWSRETTLYFLTPVPADMVWVLQ
ncbi:MAG: DUF348 domain-containing protein [Anaerolineaceae bacterium]|nr:DUF348 domain-containing protein [Anaerolineaceae bacterium]